MRGGNDTTTAKGKRAEDQACAFLETHRLTVVARNYHCQGGEIDLVCSDGRTLIFIEVRQRENQSFGGAGASITRTKQRRIIKAARHYLLAAGQTHGECRIDCILIDAGVLTWIKNAISAD